MVSAQKLLVNGKNAMARLEVRREKKVSGGRTGTAMFDSRSGQHSYGLSQSPILISGSGRKPVRKELELALAAQNY